MAYTRTITLVYDADPRCAWRQWCMASAQWQERWEHFVQHREPLPPGVLLGSRRALSRVVMAQHAAEQAIRAELPPFPEVCRGMTSMALVPAVGCMVAYRPAQRLQRANTVPR